MTWQPNSGPEMAKSRAAMLQRVRRYFDSQDVLEVNTPALVEVGVTDPALECLTVSIGTARGCLHTSPEYRMKRLLAAGYPNIYQVCRVFRGGERGRHHLPEFTMIEWYRLGFGLDAIVSDSLSLVTTMFADLGLGAASIVEFCDVFDQALGLDPLSASGGQIADALHADTALRTAVGDDRDAWLDLAMATRVAPGFDADRLTAVRHYPASQASLARLCPANPDVADRFELYLGPLELANGFVELTNPDEQRRRFEADREKRAALGKPDVPVDTALIDAMRAGLPPCAGVAMGLDRALMIAEGRNNISDVITFTPGPVA